MPREYFGTNYSDTIYGSSGDDNIYGYGGDDLLDGRGGDDWIFGGSGDDIIYGGSGNDDLFGGTGTNDLYGGSGYDYFVMGPRTSAGFSDDLVQDFELGIDKIDLRDWGVSDFTQVLALIDTDFYGDATLNAFYAGYDHWLTVDDEAPWELVASDFVFADPAAITATGTGYDDVMFGSRYGDSLRGEAGHDILLGGLGNDSLNGGSGNDDIVGGDGNDAMVGGTGSDLLEGNSGADYLGGGSGGDFLYGDSGNDRLRGGSAADDMYGGSGADTFIFVDGEFGGTTRSTADYIGDFSHAAGDRIDLRLVDAVAGGGDNAFTFIGNQPFTGGGGQLRYFYYDGDTFVAGDTNGDRVADFLIYLEGNYNLVASDFLL